MQSFLVQRILGSDEQAVQVDGLDDEVKRPLLDALHRRLDGAVAGNHYYGAVDLCLTERRKKFHAINLRHFDI